MRRNLDGLGQSRIRSCGVSTDLAILLSVLPCVKHAYGLLGCIAHFQEVAEMPHTPEYDRGTRVSRFGNLLVTRMTSMCSERVVADHAWRYTLVAVRGPEPELWVQALCRGISDLTAQSQHLHLASSSVSRIQLGC